jgi:hypothetical protein
MFCPSFERFLRCGSVQWPEARPRFECSADRGLFIFLWRLHPLPDLEPDLEEVDFPEPRTVVGAEDAETAAAAAAAAFIAMDETVDEATISAAEEETTADAVALELLEVGVVELVPPEVKMSFCGPSAKPYRAL